MIRIESLTLEQAYKDAAAALACSVSELVVEVIQVPSSGFLGFFKKNAIIVAAKKQKESQVESKKEPQAESKKEPQAESKREYKQERPKQEEFKKRAVAKKSEPYVINDTIMPQTFVSTQDDEDYDMAGIHFTADYEEDEAKEQKDEGVDGGVSAFEVAKTIEKEINELFSHICFKIDKIEVSAYDDKTLLMEFKGEDAALLIGKEGYRYKALSYMIFNWINTKYQLQLRLEIAEFLKNQEESISRYLTTVYENVDRDGRAQTKILDGVLVQIALKELRDRYPDKYVAIRSTRDGLKFIIINDYHN